MIGATSQRDACSRALDDWRWSLRTTPKTDGAVAGAPREYQSTGVCSRRYASAWFVPPTGARRTCATRSGKRLEPCARRSPQTIREFTVTGSHRIDLNDNLWAWRARSVHSPNSEPAGSAPDGT